MHSLVLIYGSIFRSS